MKEECEATLTSPDKTHHIELFTEPMRRRREEAGPGQRAPSRGSSTLSILFPSSSCWRSTMSPTFPLGSPACSASRPKWRDTSTGTGSCVCHRLGRRCRRYQKAKVSCGQINGKVPFVLSVFSKTSVEESHINDSQKKCI